MVTAGADGLGPTEVATDAAAFLTAPVAASRVLLVCLLTMSADETVEDTEDVTPPTSEWLSVVPESALAAVADNVIQSAVPAPAIMTERRI
jgi:hypothetical protein